MANTKKIFNQGSMERFEEARIIGGNPNGIFNFNRTPHIFARKLYKAMCARTWFPEQVNISKDKINYNKLSIEEKKAYDLVLAQLIANDSIQTNQLMDKINSYITSPIVNAALSRQSSEECVVKGTEVLTPHGWVKIENIDIGDTILCCNDDHESYFSKVLHMTVKELPNDDNVIRLKNGHFEQVVTAGHRVPYVQTDLNRIQTTHAINIHNDTISMQGKSYLSNVKGQSQGGYINKITKDTWDKLPSLYLLSIVLNLTDSKVIYTTFDKDWHVVYVEGDRRIKHFESLLANANLITYTVKKVGDTKKNNPIKEYKFKATLPKFINDVSKLTYKSAVEIIENLIVYDDRGYKLFNNNSTNKPFTYDTYNKENADYITSIAVLGGYSVKYTKKYISGNTVRYRVCISNEVCVDSDTIRVKKHRYTDNVYCPTVEGGYFFIKYNNKVSITGNCIHSESYAIMAEDIAQDTDRIYNMHKLDKELWVKNEAIENMYASIYTGGEPTVNDILLAFAANQILEGLIFPSGFVVMFSLENKLVGSAELIKEIN